MAEQLSLAQAADLAPVADAEKGQQRVLLPVPNLDVHLLNPQQAVAHISGADPEYTLFWLSKIVSSVEVLRSRRVAFPAGDLDRLLAVRPPANVTLDAAALAVARALWARAYGWKPLKVTRYRSRLLANSTRWPTGWKVEDAPWTAIACLVHCGLPLEVEPKARSLMAAKLGKEGAHIAEAGLAGSAVALETNRPDLLESMHLPGLAYEGGSGTGRYRLPVLLAGELLDRPEIKLTPEATQAIRKALRKERPIATSPDFPWNLFGFQSRDLSRAVKIIEIAGGVLLAGDMGSGKTTVSLALATHLDLWPLLVVCPPAAVSTWDRQLSEMGKRFYFANEPTAVASERILNEHFDAVLMTFDRLHQFVDAVEQAGFAGICGDEIQRIRNPGSRRSRAVRRLAAAVPMRIGLSGTPITNRVEDILPIGAFLVPGEWPARANGKDLEDLYPGDALESLAEHLGSMMVRRRMEDTGVKLPGKTVKRVFVPLTADQRNALENLEAEAQAAKEEGELADHMHVFARLQKMRQVVNIPSAAGVTGPSPKVQVAVDIAAEFAERGEKSIIFVADRAAWIEAGRACKEAGLGWTGIWGSTPIADRIANEKRYHNDPNTMVFIGTLASCAESLTLSPTARCTIFAALSYSPSALAQASARAYRMNTTHPVTEIYLSAQGPDGTLDDRIWELVTLKRELFAKIVDRTTYTDEAQQVSLGDLVYLLTGSRDEKLDRRLRDAAEEQARHQARKDHARGTAHRHKKGNADYVKDDGQVAKLLSDMDDSGKRIEVPASPYSAELEAMLDQFDTD